MKLRVPFISGNNDDDTDDNNDDDDDKSPWGMAVPVLKLNCSTLLTNTVQNHISS